MQSCSTSESSEKEASTKNLKQNYLEKTNIEFKGQQYNIFHNGMEAYEILVPHNWLHKNNKNTALTLYTSKLSNTDFVESLDVVSQKATFRQLDNGEIKTNKVDFDKFLAAHLNDLTENSKLEIVAEGRDTISDKAAKWVLFKTANEGEKLNLLKYFMTADGRIYIITGTCKEKDYAVYGPQFNDIVSSFKLL